MQPNFAQYIGKVYCAVYIYTKSIIIFLKINK